MVVHSSVLEVKKEKTLKKRIAKQKEELEKSAKELARQRFACIPDAERALKSLQEKAEAMGFATQDEIKLEENVPIPARAAPRRGNNRKSLLLTGVNAKLER
ncbi:hypothetical protein Tph_c01400 [Thermacetogenium phaeum DSM 12270]|uniref:Uncharacterized protein n=1 Tax=Thermacetogenium phaeum (strain ATCC BAA-254 / DSM 26808 / PB) TaxID=1089553 RepID=K4LCC9_THEPS|nr:hypothetical protein [Thermacetogenium phaeum]AFV10388.1 hypothetical protein Tph_c01400 [Thermacetogenium phaeum DSM 12270]